MKTSSEYIWGWYQVFEDYKASGLSQRKYCLRNNIEWQLFTSTYYRLALDKSFCSPKDYEKLFPLAKQCRDSKTAVIKFATEHKLNQSLFKRMMRHVQNNIILDNMKKLGKSESKSIFAEMASNLNLTLEPEAEVPAVTEHPEVEPMHFLQMPSLQGATPRPPMQPEHEVMPKQNDIEITITQGVKVSISPGVDSMKIIKIIELLKEL